MMQRGQFNLSHHHLTTCDMGELIPLAIHEVLPGDTFRNRSAVLLRVAPLANPVMHPVEVRLHWWYTPLRILWAEFDEWITGEDEVSSKPTVSLGTGASGALADFFGATRTGGVTLDATPFRAYNAIYNEFYRDQDLTSPRAEDTASVARVSWGKDYFTTCRASPGDEDISIPFDAASAPVVSQTTSSYPDAGSGPYGPSAASIPAGGPPYTWNTTNEEIYADLSQASGAIRVEDLQRAMALRRFAIARRRFGDRYVDYLRFLGVNPSDGRLSRPEYIGGGKNTISFSEVLATAEGGGVSPGDMYGHGLAAVQSRRFSKMFEEHGWLMCLLSVRPKTIYTENIPRKFTRFDPMDHWQKELEIEPWQPVYQNEVYATGDPATIFGWQNKYAEYRHELSYVSGSFKGGTENDWHMARELGGAPTLNASFIECTPTDRIYQDVSMPELLISANHNTVARRLVRQSPSLG